MSEDWNRNRYDNEKHRFIKSRLLTSAIYLHTALIFTITWLAAWLCSWALLKLGMQSMPARYAAAFFASYWVFVFCVRVWADFVRTQSDRSGAWDGGGLDLPMSDAEGCFVVLAALLMGLLMAAVFSLAGGLPLLLEVAFELAFAGVVVRRMSSKQTLGDWFGTLVRNTWLHALVTLVVLVAVAAWLQAHAPQATTFAGAVSQLWAAR